MTTLGKMERRNHNNGSSQLDYQSTRQEAKEKSLEPAIGLKTVGHDDDDDNTYINYILKEKLLKLIIFKTPKMSYLYRKYKRKTEITDIYNELRFLMSINYIFEETKMVIRCLL